MEMGKSITSKLTLVVRWWCISTIQQICLSFCESLWLPPLIYFCGAGTSSSLFFWFVVLFRLWMCYMTCFIREFYICACTRLSPVWNDSSVMGKMRCHRVHQSKLCTISQIMNKPQPHIPDKAGQLWFLSVKLLKLTANWIKNSVLLISCEKLV